MFCDFMTENWIIELFCVYKKIECQWMLNNTFNTFFFCIHFFIDDEQYATAYVYDNVFDCIFDYNNRSLS